jgi:5-formyltetrahydrofolate cyclo-ligase
MNIKNYKQQLRVQLLKKRQLLSLQEWQEKSDRLCDNLENLSIFKEATTILAYFSSKKEPDLSRLFNHHNSYKWGFPRCVNKSLIWHSWQPEDKLEKGAYGINEPSSNLPVINAHEVDLILVPAIACDYQGFRLGYGGGYYDRMLSLPEWQNIPTIGIIFDFAYVPKVPVEIWDRKLDYICTNSKVYLIEK